MGKRAGMTNTYEWTPLRTLADQAEHLSYGMLALDLVPEIQADDQAWRLLGIFSYNREEWYALELAAMYQKMTVVGLHTNICDKHFYHILQETGLTTIALSELNLKAFMKLKENDSEGKMGGVKNIIWLEEKISQEHKEMLEGAGLAVHLYRGVIDKGRETSENAGGGEQVNEEAAKIKEPEPEDCFLLCYGPGTINGEGDGSTPLGVKVTHKMMIQTVFAVQSNLPEANRLSKNDIYLSHVPSSHLFEQVLFAFSIVYLVKCGFESPPRRPVEEALPKKADEEMDK